MIAQIYSYFLLQDDYITTIRQSLNQVRLLNPAMTQIEGPFLDHGLLYDFLNWIYALLVIVFPVLFFGLYEIWYLPVFVFYCGIWYALALLCQHAFTEKYFRPDSVLRVVAVFFAYVGLLAFYVPDYGAFARYMVVVLPSLAVGLLMLTK